MYVCVCASACAEDKPSQSAANSAKALRVHWAHRAPLLLVIHALLARVALVLLVLAPCHGTTARSSHNTQVAVSDGQHGNDLDAFLSALCAKAVRAHLKTRLTGTVSGPAPGPRAPLRSLYTTIDSTTRARKQKQRVPLRMSPYMIAAQ